MSNFPSCSLATPRLSLWQLTRAIFSYYARLIIIRVSIRSVKRDCIRCINANGKFARLISAECSGERCMPGALFDVGEIFTPYKVYERGHSPLGNYRFFDSRISPQCVPNIDVSYSSVLRSQYRLIYLLTSLNGKRTNGMVNCQLEPARMILIATERNRVAAFCRIHSEGQNPAHKHDSGLMPRRAVKVGSIARVCPRDTTESV